MEIPTMRVLEGSDRPKSPFPIVLVASRFNGPITDKLVDGAMSALRERGFGDDDVTLLWVPGAVELAVAAKHAIARLAPRAVILLGAVVRGETTHYDYVCAQASDGCRELALATGVPVVFGVLTTENEEQALERVGGAHGHKGRDAVETACRMVDLVDRLGTLAKR
jgi:6,7-dimethyl-8-ribityllumazine synthase